MTNDFLEFMNLYLALLDLFAVIMLGRYIGRRWNPIRYWNDSGVQLAVGIFIHLTSLGGIRAWTFGWRFVDQHSDWFPPGVLLISRQAPALPILILTATIGMLLIVRQLSGTMHWWLWGLIVVITAEISAFFAWAL
jgi:hypothetical protein